MATVLVGGAGFIGSALAKRLAANAQNVTILNKPGENLRHLSAVCGGLKIVEGHLSDLGCVARALAGAASVVYLVHSNTKNPLELDAWTEIRENLAPLLSMLNEAAKAGVKRFVFISSGGTVYGKADELPIPESHRTAPISAHGACKLAMEHYVRIHCESLGMDAVIVRLGNAYGAGKRLGTRQGLVPELISRIIQEKPIEIWGDGSAVRDYIHVDDVGRALELALEAPVPAASMTFNLGSGIGTSVNQMIERVETALNKRATILRKEARAVDVPANVLCIQRVKSWLNWSPNIGLAEGVASLCAHYGRTGA